MVEKMRSVFTKWKVCKKQISKSCSGFPANSIQSPWGFKQMDHVLDPLKAKISQKELVKNLMNIFLISKAYFDDFDSCW